MTIVVRPGSLSQATLLTEPAPTGRLRYGSRLRPRPNLQLRSWNRPVPISVRYYLMPETGPLRLIPQRVADGLTHDRDAIPELANSRQRVAQVIVDNEAGKTVRILDVKGHYWEFGEGGRLKHDHEWMRWVFDRPERTGGKVVDLRPEIERAQWKARTRWEVTGEDMDRIAAAVWPGSAVGAEAVKAVTGRAPRRPSLTHEARESLRKLSSLVSEVGLALESLSEPGLKGLAFEARDYAGVYEGEQPLWGAIAAAAERRRAILVQRRTGRGVFYAVVQLWRWKDDTRRVSEEVRTIDERCDGLQAAEEAARRLLAEHAHQLTARVTVEAEVLTELEWVPIKRLGEAQP